MNSANYVSLEDISLKKYLNNVKRMFSWIRFLWIHFRIRISRYSFYWQASSIQNHEFRKISQNIQTRSRILSEIASSIEHILFACSAKYFVQDISRQDASDDEISVEPWAWDIKKYLHIELRNKSNGKGADAFVDEV